MFPRPHPESPGGVSQSLGVERKDEGRKRIAVAGCPPKFLLDPVADFVVCDEGHVLRQEKSNLLIAVSKIRTMWRIVLTGTPCWNVSWGCGYWKWGVVY